MLKKKSQNWLTLPDLTLLTDPFPTPISKMYGNRSMLCAPGKKKKKPDLSLYCPITDA